MMPAAIQTKGSAEAGSTVVVRSPPSHARVSAMEALGVREKYELELVPIAIGGKRLHFYSITNWDVFVAHLSQEGEAYIKSFPFWVKIWEASIVLTDHLIGMGLGPEKEILEIGAGMGVTGLFLAAFGHKVTITDHEEEALELLRMNVEHNGLQNVSVKKLDWNHPDLTGTYDVICGSELVYNDSCIKPIIRLFRRYLRPKASVFLAHDLTRMCMLKFIGMVPGRFEIDNVVKIMRGTDELEKIVIHTLRLTS
jgi:2-polyprenyl-3-methyl-5-hydroxy-6-metoxy-1,4-benzoquinol methylase